MVTTDQPPDEAEGGSGSGYAYALSIRASPQHQTAEVRGTIWCSETSVDPWILEVRDWKPRTCAIHFNGTSSGHIVKLT